ncbi:hypothetical protein HMPREF0983_03071 [Erysipelotrichaceae bacterium 3_1_53]|nr:hypothetical protein HMPREF0983_03071 [Erysipelotrichaceae bacterium 3_1_53]
MRLYVLSCRYLPSGDRACHITGGLIMLQTLILLAGYPGTGKSYLAKLLMKRFSGFEMLSPDEIKEEFWDAYGFRNEQEKEELIQKSWTEYYQRMEWKLAQGISLLSDYPFSHKQHDQLQAVCERHHVQIITIRMIADLDVLFERQKKGIWMHPGISGIF